MFTADAAILRVASENPELGRWPSHGAMAPRGWARICRAAGWPVTEVRVWFPQTGQEGRRAGFRAETIPVIPETWLERAAELMEMEYLSLCRGVVEIPAKDC